MCTVTFIPSSANSSFILTSNRDEKEYRATAHPEKYPIGDIDIAYPKDKKAGGSWIAIGSNGYINCLLNGGYENHQKKACYTISRGIMLLELAASDLRADMFFKDKELSSVEPFTIVSVKQTNGSIKELTEFIWDGQTKNFRLLDEQQAYIWSSVTLYNKEHRALRQQWFDSFVNDNKGLPDRNKLYDFHLSRHSSDEAVNIRMQRQGGLKTVSVTQVSVCDKQLKMTYNDLLTENVKDLIL